MQAATICRATVARLAQRHDEFSGFAVGLNKLVLGGLPAQQCRKRDASFGLLPQDVGQLLDAQDFGAFGSQCPHCQIERPQKVIDTMPAPVMRHRGQNRRQEIRRQQVVVFGLVIQPPEPSIRVHLRSRKGVLGVGFEANALSD